MSRNTPSKEQGGAPEGSGRGRGMLNIFKRHPKSDKNPNNSAAEATKVEGAASPKKRGMHSASTPNVKSPMVAFVPAELESVKKRTPSGSEGESSSKEDSKHTQSTSPLGEKYDWYYHVPSSGNNSPSRNAGDGSPATPNHRLDGSRGSSEELMPVQKGASNELYAEAQRLIALGVRATKSVYNSRFPEKWEQQTLPRTYELTKDATNSWAERIKHPQKQLGEEKKPEKFRYLSMGAGDGRGFPIAEKLAKEHQIPMTYYAEDISRGGLEIFAGRLLAEGYTLKPIKQKRVDEVRASAGGELYGYKCVKTFERDGRNRTEYKLSVKFIQAKEGIQSVLPDHSKSQPLLYPKDKGPVEPNLRDFILAATSGHQVHHVEALFGVINHITSTPDKLGSENKENFIQATHSVLAADGGTFFGTMPSVNRFQAEQLKSKEQKQRDPRSAKNLVIRDEGEFYYKRKSPQGETKYFPYSVMTSQKLTNLFERGGFAPENITLGAHTIVHEPELTKEPLRADKDKTASEHLTKESPKSLDTTADYLYVNAVKTSGFTRY